MSGPLHKAAPALTSRQRRVALRDCYHRHNLGGGNALKALTRVRRAAASHKLGWCPELKAAKPNWRAHERRAFQQLQGVVNDMEARDAA